MKRRSFRRLRAESKPAAAAGSPRGGNAPNPVSMVQARAHHHHVYVVRLDAAVRRLAQVQKDNPRSDPAKACLYVGMTGLDPEERFLNHKQGLKSSRLVRDYGLGLMPDFYQHLNPMPFEAAMQMEMDLAEDLRRQGYTVTGGH